MRNVMRSSRLLLIALGSALSALLVSPVAAADEPGMNARGEFVVEEVGDTRDDEDTETAEDDSEDVQLVSAGTLGKDTERRPAVVFGLKTVRPGHDPEIIGVFLFSRRLAAVAPKEKRSASPLRIAPARQNGVWVLMAEGRF